MLIGGKRICFHASTHGKGKSIIFTSQSSVHQNVGIHQYRRVFFSMLHLEDWTQITIFGLTQIMKIHNFSSKNAHSDVSDEWSTLHPQQRNIAIPPDTVQNLPPHTYWGNYWEFNFAYFSLVILNLLHCFPGVHWKWRDRPFSPTNLCWRTHSDQFICSIAKPLTPPFLHPPLGVNSAASLLHLHVLKYLGFGHILSLFPASLQKY